MLNKLLGVEGSLEEFRALVDGGAWNELSLPLNKSRRGGGESGVESTTRSHHELSRRLNEMNHRLSDALDEERQSRVNGLHGKKKGMG